MDYSCEECGKSFVHLRNLSRHRQSSHRSDVDIFMCEVCGKTFNRKDAFSRHMRTHDAPSYKCEICDRSFGRNYVLVKHMETHNKPPAESNNGSTKRKADESSPPNEKRQRTDNDDGESPSENVVLKESAFQRRLNTWSLKNDEQHIDLVEFLASKKSHAKELIVKELEKHELKVNFKVSCVYQKAADDDVITQEVSFKTKNAVILQSSDLDSYYAGVVDKLVAESEDFQQKDSGWTLQEILELEVRLNKYNPLKASSYLDLPPAIKNKQAVVNVQNEDQECFHWAILSALYPAKENAHRVSTYEPHKHMLSFDGITFPVNLNHIVKFEKMNNISVNVYSFSEDFSIYPLRITDCEKDIHVDLLYFKSGDQGHYCWIKNLSRLVSRQLSKNNRAKHICRRCLLYFNSQSDLFHHREICDSHQAIRVEMPSKGNNEVTFQSVQHSLQVPFVVYADFECLTVPASTCLPNGDASYTNVYQHHIPMSFCYYISYVHGHYKDPVVYRGLDAPKRFIEMLRMEAQEIEGIYKHVQPMLPLDSEAQKRHEEATECYLCHGKFTEMDGKVFEHSHISGEYRGPSHNSCNLKYKNPHFVPVIFHNLSCYDAHIFIKELGYDDAPITLIPNNEEKYISFSKKVTESMTLRFLDSFRFMASSLDVLSGNLSKDQFVHTKRYFPLDKLDLVLRKGVYPYDYMNSFDKCDETQLPPKEHFYNELNESHISDDDYVHAQTVWEAFQIKTLGEYSDLYVKTDVMLLCDVFENFRQLCMKTYELDPAWYYTAPGLSWDAMLKFTGVNIELFTDYDMLLFVEKGIRGGISQCSTRFGQANNKYMSDYNPKEPSKYLMYLDANNLYGWAMVQHLPLNGFAWCDPIDVTNVPDDSPVGYILEADFDYPSILHRDHSDMPLLPEVGVPTGCKEQRLLTTLNSKQKYIIHYRNLKQCLSLGMVLRKIHRVLRFNQSPWLKPYIDLNTHFRSKAVNDFEKDFYKLMNNSIFGKTMENIRRRVDIRLCSNGKMAEKLVAKPNFERRSIFCENLVAIHLKRTKLTFNKPIYLGMSILDISKTLMYHFHYEEMKKKYGENIKLMYTDTDSFIYEITTEDVYQDIKQNLELYDTSDYSFDNVYGIPPVNKKVLGKMKDENKGKVMTEFIGLRSKMYAFKVEGKTVKKLKGIKKHAIKHKITFHDYKECLLNSKKSYCTMNLIKSKSHRIYSVKLNKVSLSPTDSKRHILADGIHTLAIGHCDINNV